ncbi:putative phospholipase B-like 2 [Sycon ciliatum]|uniref:putative phospholipase B-like 2 n=1 Tax=Sycon ciliatum TaxID=27933 RepID=UPI0031F71090
MVFRAGALLALSLIVSSCRGGDIGTSLGDTRIGNRSVTIGSELVSEIVAGNKQIVAYLHPDPEAKQSLTVSWGEPADSFWGAVQYDSSKANSSGWSTLLVRDNAVLGADVSDLDRAQVAGFLEGLVTGQSIWDTYTNLKIQAYCVNEEAYCARLRAFMSANDAWALGRIAAARKERSADLPLWHQYALIREQLVGLMQGYNQYQKVMNLPQRSLTLEDFMMLSFGSDIDTLESALKRKVRASVLGSGSCSAIVKIIGDYEDVLFTHDTWTHFYTMLRVYKRYELHQSRDGGAQTKDNLIAASVSFSSYPGYLHSNDDFYTLEGVDMAIMETTIGNYNQTLFDEITPESQLYFYRVQIANRLARNGAEWARAFARYNSGTYNNQWMVFDYKQFTPGQPPRAGAFTVLEQLPTIAHTEDMTEFLVTNKHWPSYNLPHFKSVFQRGNFQSMVDQYGDFFSYDMSPRARIFRRDHAKVVDVKSLQHLMRYNDFQHDEYGRCQCTPPYSGENGIAARSDLNPTNGTYSIPALAHRMHGATDCKITSRELMQSGQTLAISGPTNQEQPTFKWSTSGEPRPAGHPDAFDREFVLIKFPR